MKKAALVAIVLALTLGLAGSASAAWTDMHGAMGQALYPGNTYVLQQAPAYLYFQQEPGLPNYIQYQIPTTDGTRRISQLYIRHRRSSTIGRIASVSVYCGPSLVRTVAMPAPTPNVWTSNLVALGGPYACILGWGVTLNIVNGSGATGFSIGSVGANLVP